MDEDEIKILTHLTHRKDWVCPAEIKQAWKFDDFDAAVKTLADKRYIKIETHYRITRKGREALKGS